MHPLTVEMFLVMMYSFIVAGIGGAAIGWNLPTLKNWYSKRKKSK